MLIPLDIIAEKLKLQSVRSRDVHIKGVASLQSSGENMISFVCSDKYLAQAHASKAAALIVSPHLKDE